jgi:regulator of sigma E protease
VALGVPKTEQVWALNWNVIGALFPGLDGLGQWAEFINFKDPAVQSANGDFAANLGCGGFGRVGLAEPNLLLWPMLNGGFMMYYLWQLLTGKPVSPE